MPRFRDIRTLRKTVAAHASVYNHFNLERRLTRRARSGRNLFAGRFLRLALRPGFQLLVALARRGLILLH